MMRLALLAVVVALAAPAAARPAKQPPKPPSVIDVSLVKGGSLLRYRLDGARLVVRDGAKGGAAIVDRVLTEAERARLEAAVRKAFDAWQLNYHFATIDPALFGGGADAFGKTLKLPVYFGASEATILSKRGSPRSESHLGSRRSWP